MSATILRSNLPPMIPVAEDLTAAAGYHVMRDQPHDDNPDLFRTLCIRWDDGLELYLDPANTHTCMRMAEMGVPAGDLFAMLHDMWTEHEGIYQVVDTLVV